MKQKPKVSVCIVTYNQQAYIEECLESVLAQQTDFSFEIIVGDDASTDLTRQKLQALQQRHPEQIRLVLHETNIGAAPNIYSVYAMAKGEYIAHLDGDDYMLPGKLQIQTDFMDANQHCNVSFHRMKVLGRDGTLKDDLIDVNLIPKDGYSADDVIQLITVGMHSSKMFRNSSLAMPEVEFDVVDYFINILQIGIGRAGFVPVEPLGVYRAGIGIASAGLKTRRDLANALEYFLEKKNFSRVHINSALLMLMLADLKNRRNTFFRFFWLWLISFHTGSIFLSLKRWNVIRMLRLP
ncbi:glycosyltransferase [Aquitalea sp. ASV15]|uniref:glycosyltransferase family 2 protein n=1 Tax=Aquitalea sp. ASV15 TaxID=2795104 RepID=UPI0018EDD693|nr:glycosyltransferase [Aquitalea sp. ASV15]